MSYRVIELLVSESGSGPGARFGWHVRLDGAVVAANVDLTPAQSLAVRELSWRYGQLFEQRALPQVARDAQAALGAALFDVWLAPIWGTLSNKLGLGDLRTVLIRSTSPAILNLPWELLRPPGGEPLGSDARWALRRVPAIDGAVAPGPPVTDLPPGPLRMLLMVAAPQDLPELDFEREEGLLLRALGRDGRQVVIDTGDLGSFEELRERISAFRPHIVHLSGHGVAEAGQASFAFEDESGRSDNRPTSALAPLFAGSGVQCVFVSACQAGQAPARDVLGGLAAGLVSHGVPLVIGWSASVVDGLATELAAKFYGAAATGRESVDRALSMARHGVRAACDERGDPSWSLPVLYAGSRQALVFDPAPARRQPIARPSLNLRPLPGMQEGYAEHFVGRRREQQELLPALRAGDLQALVLTGLGGVGKSTLATRLARKLEADGWRPLAVPSSAETPLDAGRLLQTLADAFLASDDEQRQAKLINPQLAVGTRLRLAVDGLNEHRFVLVLDNLESNLDEESRRFLDAELGAFYQHLLTHLTGNSRLIVTSRYLPAEPAPLPPLVRERPLGEFSVEAFLKFLWREPNVEQRARSGELPVDELRRLYRVLGGTPRFLTQMRTVLIDMPKADLTNELDRVALPEIAAEPADAGRLQAARDAYCEAIFTERLYGRLSEAEQRMLAQAAVFGLPVTAEGLSAVTGASETTVREAAAHWCELTLAHRESRDRRDLWSVYGMLRAWLLHRLDPLARQAAHGAAGAFMVTLNEQDRQAELGVGWIACLLEARMQFIAAGALDRARAVTEQINDAWLRQGLYREMQRLHEEMLHLQEHPDSLVGLARSHEERSDWRQARQMYNRALTIYQECGNRNGEAATLHQLATIDLYEGDYDTAQDTFQRALKIKQEIGDRAGEAHTWNSLATIDVQKSAYRPARDKLNSALMINKQIGDKKAQADNLHILATIDLREGAYKPARMNFQKALEIRKKINEKAGEATTLHQLGTIDLNEGSYMPARANFQKALKIRMHIGDRAGEAATWHQLGTVDFREGVNLAALKKFRTALKIRNEIHEKAGEAATLHQIASIDLKRNYYRTARKKFGKTLKIAEDIGDQIGKIASLLQLARIDLKEKKYQSARENFRQSLAISNIIGHSEGKAAAHDGLGHFYFANSEYNEAQKEFQIALEIRQKIGHREGEAATWLHLGRLAIATCEWQSALNFIGLSLFIYRTLGNGNIGDVYETATYIGRQLNLSEHQLNCELDNIGQTYTQDRGASLLG